MRSTSKRTKANRQCSKKVQSSHTTRKTQEQKKSESKSSSKKTDTKKALARKLSDLKKGKRLSPDKRRGVKRLKFKNQQGRSLTGLESSAAKSVNSQGIVKEATVVLTRSAQLDRYCKSVSRTTKKGASEAAGKDHLVTRRVNKSRKKSSMSKEGTSVSSNVVSEAMGAGSAPKKLKGSLSVKFKSWNWVKQDLGQDAVETGPGCQKKVVTKQVVFSQNDQMLQKCKNCLLYIPVESFEQHNSKDCEALHLAGSKDYICSECLACYASQKFLARHKRECPRKNQSPSIQSRYPQSSSRAGLDGMYSVVWKCHCKSNFTSAEELGKHRETCISAQQYTATCPICNIRVMGGSRTLRYHMTQNHASLFMPEETSSSSVLGGLEGTAPVEVITTQTTNLSDLVRRLSKEHSHANIRIVSVNPEKFNSQQKEGTQRKRSHEARQQAILIESAPVTLASKTRPEMDKGTSRKLEQDGHDKVVQVTGTEPNGRGSVDIGALNQAATVGMQKEVRGLSSVLVKTEEEVGSPSTGNHGDVTRTDDLKNLLVKAKALTKELEQKLATGNEDAEVASVKDGQAAARKNAKKRKCSVPSDQGRSSVEKKGCWDGEKRGSSMKQEGAEAKPAVKSRRRFSRVKCLDCQQVFDDFIELGRHKRTDCPVVISQHLSADGNFTEKVDMFDKDQKVKEQKLDVVECYYCTLCSSKFKLRSQVYEHMRFEHKNKGLSHYLNYHCPYCPRVFQTARQRHAHKLERHADIKIAPEDDFTVKETEVCPVCYQVVPIWDKDKHYATSCKKNSEENESDTFCQLCGRLLDTQEALKQHRQTEHLNAIHFRCGLCTRTFGHAVELRCHKVSHHTKNPRWEQNYAMLKLQEEKKEKSGVQSFKIHISPCVEEVKSPAVKVRNSSLGNTNGAEAQKHSASDASTSEVSISAKGPSAKSTSIRIPTDGTPLSLTPEQMKSLSKGQPIKLVLPKDADMKKLTFTVPGDDGKPKKYSLMPKSANVASDQKEDQSQSSEEPSKSSASHRGQTGDEQEKRNSPQRELAAALGLQPRGASEPARSQHRPTRLRSGRTIENKMEVTTTRRDRKEASAKVVNSRGKSSGRPSLRERKVVNTGDEPTTKKARSSENEAQQKGSESSQSNEEGTGSKKEDNMKKDTSKMKKVKTPARREAGREGKMNGAEQAVGSEKTEGRRGRTAAKRSREGEKELAPVQVLKPIGKDRVQCMRCNSILGSMQEVALHQCDGAN